MVFGFIRFLRSTRTGLQQLGAEPFAELYGDRADDWPSLGHRGASGTDTAAA